MKGSEHLSAQSVFHRLKNKNPSDLNQALKRYGNERFLYRLAQSDFKDRYILKGGALFQVWSGQMHRSTRDIDFLGTGNPEETASIFKSLCHASDEDPVIFDPNSVSVSPIKVGQKYPGIRIKLNGFLGKAKIPLLFDVGFGDVITPKPQLSSFPVLLDHAPPILFTYPVETVIAEKLHAIVVLNMLNSRMKDFFDIWYASSHFDFEGDLLLEAVQATFQRRDTPPPSELPEGLSEHFIAHPNRVPQWRAFIQTCQDRTLGFREVVQHIRFFLEPVIMRQVAGLIWRPEMGWVRQPQNLGS